VFLGSRKEKQGREAKKTTTNIRVRGEENRNQIEEFERFIKEKMKLINNLQKEIDEREKVRNMYIMNDNNEYVHIMIVTKILMVITMIIICYDFPVSFFIFSFSLTLFRSL